MGDGWGGVGASAERHVVGGSAGDMVVHVVRPAGAVAGWALVAHGRNGAAAAPHLAPIIAGCVARGLVAVVPDLCNSCHNQSAGIAADFTMAAHKADVARIAAWWAEAWRGSAGARLHIGHSMGAYAVLANAAQAAASGSAARPAGPTGRAADVAAGAPTRRSGQAAASTACDTVPARPVRRHAGTASQTESTPCDAAGAARRPAGTVSQTESAACDAAAVGQARRQAGTVSPDDRTAGDAAAAGPAPRDVGMSWPTGILAVSPAVSGAALIAARAAVGSAAVAALEREVPGALDEWPANDVMPIVGTIDVPVALIVGADDTLTTPAVTARLAAALRRCVSHDVVAGEHHCPVGPGYAASVGAALDRLLAADGGDVVARAGHGSAAVDALA